MIITIFLNTCNWDKIPFLGSPKFSSVGSIIKMRFLVECSEWKMYNLKISIDLESWNRWITQFFHYNSYLNPLIQYHLSHSCDITWQLFVPLRKPNQNMTNLVVLLQRTAIYFCVLKMKIIAQKIFIRYSAFARKCVE